MYWRKFSIDVLSVVNDKSFIGLIRNWKNRSLRVILGRISVRLGQKKSPTKDNHS